MEHTTAATVVAATGTIAGAAIAAASMVTGVAVVLAFILALAFVVTGISGGVAIVERGRPGYTGRPVAVASKAESEPEAA